MIERLFDELERLEECYGWEPEAKDVIDAIRDWAFDEMVEAEYLGVVG